MALNNLRQFLFKLENWQRLNHLILIKFDRCELWRDETCVRSDLDDLLAGAQGNLQYRGELLAGESLESDAWLLEERNLVLERWKSVALDACAGHTPSAQADLLQRLIRDDPFQGSLVRALMSLLYRQGRTEEALQAYRLFEKRLSAELGAAPSPATQKLFAQMSRTTAAEFAVQDVFADKGPSNPALPRVLLLQPSSGRNPDPIDATLVRSFLDDLTLSLSAMRSFVVIAPHTARRLLLQPSVELPPHDYLVETHFLAAPSEKCRLGVTLTNSRTFQVLLGDSIDLAEEGLATAYKNLGSAVAAAVSSQVARTELSNFSRTGVATAYVNFLMAQDCLRFDDLVHVRRAKAHLKSSVNKASNFSPALALAARCLVLEWHHLNRSDTSQLRDAADLANNALAYDPLDSAGYREKGHALLYLQDYDGSLENYERARSRAPHHADLACDEADALIHSGHVAEGKQRINDAINFNPLAPDIYLWVRGSADFFLGNYQAALTGLNQMIDTEPVTRLLAASAAMAGEHEQAAEYRARALDRHPDFKIENWTQLVPQRDQRNVNHYMEALRLAGFE